MRNLYQPADAAEIKARLARLRPDSPRQWGRMNAAQALAHCALSMEWALGQTIPKPGPLPVRILGRLIRPLALGNDKPLRRNSPTAQELKIPGERDFATERDRLQSLIGRFAATGPAGCTSHPHSFFGRLTPHEWAILTYKHLDHHLRQFSA
jgi:hypothetical protein